MIAKTACRARVNQGREEPRSTRGIRMCRVAGKQAGPLRATVRRFQGCLAGPLVLAGRLHVMPSDLGRYSA